MKKKETTDVFKAPAKIQSFEEVQKALQGITQQLNDIINRGHDSEVPYVRSLYCVYNNMLKDIKAECVYADPPAPVPKWFKKKKRDWSIPPDPPMIPPD